MKWHVYGGSQITDRAPTVIEQFCWTVVTSASRQPWLFACRFPSKVRLPPRLSHLSLVFLRGESYYGNEFRALCLLTLVLRSGKNLEICVGCGVLLLCLWPIFSLVIRKRVGEAHRELVHGSPRKCRDTYCRCLFPRACGAARACVVLVFELEV